MKAATAAKVREFEDIPNVGPRIADDFRRLGIIRPQDLAGRDPYELYEKLNAMTGGKQDPCVCDTFIAAVRFMEGGKSLPWWHFTAERQRRLKTPATAGG